MSDFQKRFPEDDPIWDYSNPLEVQQKAYKFYGPSAIIYRSRNKSKKYSIIDPNNKVVSFGSMKPPMEDFTKHKDNERRSNYLARSGKINGAWQKNGYSANNLSRRLLW